MGFLLRACLSLNDKGQLELKNTSAFIGLKSQRTESGTPEQLKIEGGLPGRKEGASEGEAFKSVYKLPSNPQLAAELFREESPATPAEGKSWRSES